MLLATALQSGLHHSKELEKMATWTGAEMEAVSIVGHAFYRVAHALQTGTRQEDRFAAMIQDLSAIRSGTACLPDNMRKPIIDKVTAGLIFDFGTRDSVGCRTHTDERYVLPGELEAARACVLWIVEEARDFSATETKRLLDAAREISQAALRCGNHLDDDLRLPFTL